MLSSNDIQVKEELWGVYDKRLPEDLKITRIPPDDTFIASIREIQLQPIGVGLDHKKPVLLFGRKRLLALRMISEEEGSERMIRVSIFNGVNPDDAHLISLIENNQRSSNEISDYDSVAYFLRSGYNYKQIAEKTGIPLGTVKALDNKWAKVPTWALKAALAGKIVPSTAIEVGKQGPEVQSNLFAEFQNTGKLSGTRVKAEKKFVQAEILATMSPGLGLTVARDFYSRQELEEVLKVVKNQTKQKAIEYIESLLD